MTKPSSSGWESYRFGEMAIEIKDRVEVPKESGFKRYVGLTHLDSGSLKIWRWGSTADVEKQKMLFKSGDIIFGRRNAYLRRISVADFDGVCSAHAMVLRARPEVALPEFLPFFMQTETFWQAALRNSAGSLSPTINWSNIAKEDFALPPLEEQGRIAEALQAAERTKNTYQSTLLSLQIVAEALGHTRASSSAQNYPLVDLEEVASVRYGLTVNQARRKSGSQAPYLRVANVQRGSLDLSEVKEIGVLPVDDGFKLRHGDVLIVEGHADPTAIGRAAVWLDATPGMMHQNHLIRARCSEALNHDFLCMLINSPHGMVHFQSRAKSSSGLNTINSTVVKKYRIPLPPREVQDQIVGEFSEISDAAGAASIRLEKLKALSDQLLRSATEGQL